PGREKARQIRRRFAAVKDERPVVRTIDAPLRGGVRITVRIAERARQELGRRLCHLPDRACGCIGRLIGSWRDISVGPDRKPRAIERSTAIRESSYPSRAQMYARQS